MDDRAGWVRGSSTPESAGVTLERVIDHIDHICQIAGNARHCMIGSDLDGAFGREQCPSDVETIADLAKIPGGDLLRKRGYAEDEGHGIMHRNFVRFLRAPGGGYQLPRAVTWLPGLSLQVLKQGAPSPLPH